MIIVVLDTNIFVATGFNRDSHAARIVRAVEEGELRMVWNEATRREIRQVLEHIPPLSWKTFADLFREEERYSGATHPDHFDYIDDPDDRKFAALAEAADALLVSLDDDLLEHRTQAGVTILTSGEFLERYLQEDAA
ncbi:MAG: PIN domain-containing protein [Anaerolineales bacterium]